MSAVQGAAALHVPSLSLPFPRTHTFSLPDNHVTLPSAESAARASSDCTFSSSGERRRERPRVRQRESEREGERKKGGEREAITPCHLQSEIVIVVFLSGRFPFSSLLLSRIQKFTSNGKGDRCVARGTVATEPQDAREVSKDPSNKSGSVAFIHSRNGALTF